MRRTSGNPAQPHTESGRPLQLSTTSFTKLTARRILSTSPPAERQASAAWAPASATRTRSTSTRASRLRGRLRLLAGGKTVIRSGFGIYHGDGQLDDQNVPIKNEVGAYSLSAKSTPGLSYPITPFLNGPGTRYRPMPITATAKTCTSLQWGLSVQRALPHDLVGTLSYVGSKGNFLLITSYVNLIDPATGLRPYPAFGQVQVAGKFQQQFLRRLRRQSSAQLYPWLLVSANYTYSHQIDQDAPGGGDSDNPQNPACMACERASGDFDARHVVNANVVYDLPFGPWKAFLSQPGVARAVLGRWSVTDIICGAYRYCRSTSLTSRSSSSVATGYTTNQRPNLVPGVSLTPPGGKSIRGTTMNWINPAAFTAVPDPRLRRHSTQHRSRPESVADRSRALQAHSTY